MKGFISCDSSIVEVAVLRGVLSPYRVVVYSNSDTMYSYSKKVSNFRIKRDVFYTVVSIDKCWDSIIQTLTNTNELTMNYKANSCVRVNFKTLAINKSIIDRIDHCLKFLVQDTMSKVSEPFYTYDLRAKKGGCYKIMKIDTCCKDTVSRIECFPVLPVSFSISKTARTGLDSTTGVRIQLDEVNLPLDVILISSPWTSSDSLNTSAKQLQKGPLVANYLVGDTLLRLKNHYMYIANVPLGTYKFAFADTCGNRDTFEFTISTADLYLPTQNYKINQACPSGHSVYRSITLNKSYYNSPNIVFRQIKPLVKNISLNQKSGRYITPITLFFNHLRCRDLYSRNNKYWARRCLFRES